MPLGHVLVLSMHDDPAYLRSVLASGASGYVTKRAIDTELLAAIRAVHRGGVFIDPSLAHVFVQGRARQTRDCQRSIAILEDTQ
jgi:two-component system response regulator NreC